MIVDISLLRIGDLPHCGVDLIIVEVGVQLGRVYKTKITGLVEDVPAPSPWRQPMGLIPSEILDHTTVDHLGDSDLESLVVVGVNLHAITLP